MKNFKTLFFLLFTLYFTSCENNVNTISITFIHELTKKPIAGIEVNIYEWYNTFDKNVKRNEVKLLSNAKSDSNGRATFLIDNDMIDNTNHCFYALKYNKDTLSKNSKYAFDNSIYSDIQVDWGHAKVFQLHPALFVKINLLNVQPNETFELISGNQRMNRIMNNIPSISSFYLEPGMTHKIEIYKVNEGEKKYLSTKKIYIKYPDQNADTDFVFTSELKTSSVDITL